MGDKVRVSLRYSGHAVVKGSMELNHAIAALSGFSTAYTKIADAKRLNASHELRIAGLHRGSAEFIIQVLTANKDLLVSAGAGLTLLKVILEIVKLTKHSQGEETKVRPQSNGNIVVTNSQNVSINVSHDVYDIYQDGLIRQDLNKLVEPLDVGKVDSLEIAATNKEDGAEEDISSEEKKYFGYIPKEVAETKEMILEGRLFSVNTEINRGSLRLPNGDRVGYRFKTDHPERFYKHVMRKGLVRVKCIAHLDENLKPVHIDILDIIPLDPDLPFGTR